VSQGPEEGQAAVPVGGGRAQPGFKIDHSKPYAHETHAVPVGGGRAWPGFEIDHSERSSRVAISRAGRRPEHQRRNKQQKWEAAAHGHNQQPGPTAHRRRPLPLAASPHNLTKGHLARRTKASAFLPTGLLGPTDLLRIAGCTLT